MELLAATVIITGATMLAIAAARGTLEMLFYAMNRQPGSATAQANRSSKAGW